MLSVLTCVVDNCSLLMIRNMMALSEGSMELIERIQRNDDTVNRAFPILVALM